jgi:hypothetical protein
MPTGLDKLKHVVVQVMGNRSVGATCPGALMAQDPRIDGLTGGSSRPSLY